MSVFKWLKTHLGDSSAGLVSPTGQHQVASQRRYSIESAWRDHLAPAIREAGFKGSGRNYRLVTEQFALAVNLQGSRYGGEFTVNLGVQPLATPNAVGDMVEPKYFKEMECIFRDRLSADGRDTWWSYADDAASMNKAAQEAAALFRVSAMSQFNERINFALFATPETVGRGPAITLASLALLREAQGEVKQARAFARMARETAISSWITPTSLLHLLGD